MKVIDAEKLQKEDLHESVFYLEKYGNIAYNLSHYV